MRHRQSRSQDEHTVRTSIHEVHQVNPAYHGHDPDVQLPQQFCLSNRIDINHRGGLFDIFKFEGRVWRCIGTFLILVLWFGEHRPIFVSIHFADAAMKTNWRACEFKLEQVSRDEVELL